MTSLHLTYRQLTKISILQQNNPVYDTRKSTINNTVNSASSTVQIYIG